MVSFIIEDFEKEESLEIDTVSVIFLFKFDITDVHKPARFL